MPPDNSFAHQTLDVRGIQLQALESSTDLSTPSTAWVSQRPLTAPAVLLEGRLKHALPHSACTPQDQPCPDLQQLQSPSLCTNAVLLGSWLVALAYPDVLSALQPPSQLVSTDARRKQLAGGACGPSNSARLATSPLQQPEADTSKVVLSQPVNARPHRAAWPCVHSRAALQQHQPATVKPHPIRLIQPLLSDSRMASSFASTSAALQQHQAAKAISGMETDGTPTTSHVSKGISSNHAARSPVFATAAEVEPIQPMQYIPGPARKPQPLSPKARVHLETVAAQNAERRLRRRWHRKVQGRVRLCKKLAQLGTIPEQRRGRTKPPKCALDRHSCQPQYVVAENLLCCDTHHVALAIHVVYMAPWLPAITLPSSISPQACMLAGQDGNASKPEHS